MEGEVAGGCYGPVTRLIQPGLASRVARSRGRGFCFGRRKSRKRFSFNRARDVTKMAMEARCGACGKDYTNRRAARFCSAACKQRAYRGRVQSKAAAAERARDLAQREAERAREATRKAIDLAHALIG